MLFASDGSFMRTLDRMTESFGLGVLLALVLVPLLLLQYWYVKTAFYRSYRELADSSWTMGECFCFLGHALVFPIAMVLRLREQSRCNRLYREEVAAWSKWQSLSLKEKWQSLSLKDKEKWQRLSLKDRVASRLDPQKPCRPRTFDGVTYFFYAIAFSLWLIAAYIIINALVRFIAYLGS